MFTLYPKFTPAEGFSFPTAASPLTDNGLKENNPLALRVLNEAKHYFT